VIHNVLHDYRVRQAGRQTIVKHQYNKVSPVYTDVCMKVYQFTNSKS